MALSPIGILNSPPMCVVSIYCAYWHLVDPCPRDQTMIMKMLSYMATNSYLRYASQKSAETMTQTPRCNGSRWWVGEGYL